MDIVIHDTCPWTEKQIKLMVKKAIERLGGPKGFEFLGENIQQAIIAECIWRALAAQVTPIVMTAKCASETEREFCKAAGIWVEEEDS